MPYRGFSPYRCIADGSAHQFQLLRLSVCLSVCLSLCGWPATTVRKDRFVVAGSGEITWPGGQWVTCTDDSSSRTSHDVIVTWRRGSSVSRESETRRVEGCSWKCRKLYIASFAPAAQPAMSVCWHLSSSKIWWEHQSYSDHSVVAAVASFVAWTKLLDVEPG